MLIRNHCKTFFSCIEFFFFAFYCTLFLLIEFFLFVQSSPRKHKKTHFTTVPTKIVTTVPPRTLLETNHCYELIIYEKTYFWLLTINVQHMAKYICIQETITIKINRTENLAFIHYVESNSKNLFKQTDIFLTLNPFSKLL